MKKSFVIFALIAAALLFGRVASACSGDADCPSGYKCLAEDLGDGAKGLRFSCQKVSGSSGTDTPTTTPDSYAPPGSPQTHNPVPSSGGMSQSTQQGTPTGGGSQSSGFGNPIGVDSIEGVLGNVMSYLQGIAGAIAVIFIIIGGIMYMISGGSKEMSERAKKTLIFAIVGLAIVLAAPLFYQEIKAVLSGNNPGSALQQLLLNILKLLLSIVGFLAIISMVVGAIWMFTAVGDEDKYELGKKMAGYSIFGLVIALSALIIANQVTNLIGG